MYDAFRMDRMSYQFQGDEAVPDGVRRIAGEEIAAALGRLNSTGARDEAVHEVRKSVKKVRGLLRLLRPGLGDVYSRENVAWRNIGRQLSELRDAGVVVEVFDDLRERYPAEVSSVVRRRLLANKRRMEKAGRVAEVLAGVAAELRRASRRLAKWPIEGDGFQAIALGLRCTYSRGQRAVRRVRKHTTPENLHDLRKRVKEQLYQVRLLSGLWDEGMRRREARLSKLEETLGEHHNVHVLRTALAGEKGLEGFFEFLAELEWKLAKRGLRLAVHVFGESPGRVVGRVERLWDAHWVS